MEQTTRRTLMAFIALLLLAALAAIQAETAEFESPSSAAEAFVSTLKSSFATWDGDHDGTLSKAEIDALLADPRISGDAAAALAVVKRLARNKTWGSIPRTLAHLSALAVAPKTGPGPDLANMFADARRRIASANRELFSHGGPKLERLHQGNLGDCFALAPLGTMPDRDAGDVEKKS